MPRRKKDPSTRARRNKASTAATLTIAEPATNAEAYQRLTVVQLRAEIDRRNLGRPAHAVLNKRGPKAGLVAALVADDSPAPKLPGSHEWHPLTVEWWDDLWASPMAGEYHTSDRHALFILAALVDAFWAMPSKDLAAEIRLQRQAFGLTPYDRRRLEWTIETAAEAQDRGKQRRQRQAQGAKQPDKASDPRQNLHAV